MEAMVRTKRIKTEYTCPLPEEIVEDILSRLPAKSLLRFRCVSRPWDALITSAPFEDLHLRRSNSGGGGGNRRLFLKPRGCFEPFYAWKRGSPVETITSTTHLPQGTIFPITNSCRGLILLRSLECKTCYVWNSSTNEVLPLPDKTPFKLAWLHISSSSSLGTYMAYGLGYCPRIKQYKVVRMYNLDGCDNEAASDTVCEVFTLHESTHWRPAATPPPACKVRVDGRQGVVLCNGNLHFVMQRGLITTFNVSHETFSLLIPPPELQSDTEFLLSELDGCLCAFYAKQKNLDLAYSYHIWLLRDHVAGHWEKVRCIDWQRMSKTEREPFKSSWIAPLDMYYDDSAQKKKKIMFGTGSCKVFVVDPDTGTPEILFSPPNSSTTIGQCPDGPFPTMGLLEESLVWVGPTSVEIIFSSQSAQAWSKVLARLLTRVVGRLNQVCKEWRAMIKTGRFVRAHMHYANLNRSPQIMFTDGRPRMFKAMEGFINTSGTPPLVNGGSRLVCSRACYGLCAGSFTNYDFVCNPITGYYKAIPLDNGWELNEYSVRHAIETRPLDFSGNVEFMGRLALGYELHTGMHVLVRLTYKERNFTTRDYKLECKIRCIQDMYWYVVDPPPRPAANMPPAYADGKLYWMADPELGPRSPAGCEIIMFDISTREFHIFEGPPCSHGSGHMSILELQGEVCVACSCRSTNTITIWAMNGNGVWSVQHYIELAKFLSEYSLEEVTPLAIDPKDKRILLSTGRALGYYDPRTVELETIYRLGTRNQGMKFIPVLVMESLVSPYDVLDPSVPKYKAC